MASRAVASRAAAVTASIAVLSFPGSASAQTACAADLNGDGVVSANDLSELLAHWGACGPCVGDLNGDAQIDGLDLGVLLERWGPCPVGNPDPIPFMEIPVTIDSGDRAGAGTGVEPVYSEVVASPNAEWMRVIFDASVTALKGPVAGDGAAFMRITSMNDGLCQTLNAQTLVEWGFTSAYFNGDAVRIEIFAAEGGSGRVAVLGVHAGVAMEGGVATICGPTDDRCQSSDPRVGRITPVACTAFLFDNKQNALLSAGHCAASFNFSAPEVVQFNVPKSNQNGTVQHPSPSHQYVVDSSSVQFKNSGVSNDWGHFGVFSNSNTGLSPFVAQGMRSFVRGAAKSSGLVRITGFGVDDGWENKTNQTHVGPNAGVGPGSVVYYQSDTKGGNSGSPIIRESDGAAIGIHTHGGCSASGGSNKGTTFANAGLVQAIANPLGVAAAAPLSDLDGDGLVNGADLAMVLGGWGPCSGCAQDLNSDGIVNGSDLAALLGSWPPAPNPPSVPSWATLIEAAPDPAVVTDVNLRNAIIATGLAWRVRDNSSQIEMLLVPPGTFQMGCSPSNQWGCSGHENPVHSVTLTCPFYMGLYEVTQVQWTAKMGSNPSFFQGSSYPNAANRPVELVSWTTIQGFLSVTGLRLPTEAEWEFAYRAGTATAFHSMPGNPSGTNDDTLVGNIAWWGGNSGSQTHAVGGKSANALGLHDMSGNVWEWVNDRYSSTYYASSPSTNPPGPASGSFHVLRGGSWNDNSSDLRSASRNGGAPGDANDHYGLRVARSP